MKLQKQNRFLKIFFKKMELLLMPETKYMIFVLFICNQNSRFYYDDDCFFASVAGEF